MKTFREYYEDRPVLNTIEKIDIEGIGVVASKIDSGNEAYNVLHGTDLNYTDNTVSFTTVDSKQLSKPFEGKINIHIGSGVKEERPIVKLNIKLHNRPYSNVPFTIADRSENTEPVLIGEPFIKQINALIDVNSRD